MKRAGRRVRRPTLTNKMLYRKLDGTYFDAQVTYVPVHAVIAVAPP